MAFVDGDQAEKKRRLQFSRCVRHNSSQCPCQRPRSALEEIEEQSQALLVKGSATRFIDKGEDSKQVARLIERLREAVSHYQVSECRVIALIIIDVEEQISQQQGVYDQIADLTVSVLSCLRLLRRQ